MNNENINDALIVLAGEGRKVTIQKCSQTWKVGLIDADGKELVEVETGMLGGAMMALHDAGARALYAKRHPVEANKKFAAG